MTQALPAIWFDQAPSPADAPAGDGVMIDLALPVCGGTLRARLAAPAGPLGLAGIVPVARRLADEIVRLVARDAAGGGRSVPCRSGCSACCRYLVPISVPEALRLSEEIDTLPPKQRRAAFRNFTAAASRILRARPPELNQPSRDADGHAEGLRAISRWYRRLDLSCPFLAEGLCAAYPHRPIACREHLVTGPAGQCADARPDAAAPLEMPLSVGEALCRLAAEVEGTPPESILLPLALQWRSIDPGRSRRAWPGAELARRFADILEDLAGQATSAGRGRFAA